MGDINSEWKELKIVVQRHQISNLLTNIFDCFTLCRINIRVEEMKILVRFGLFAAKMGLSS